MYLFKESVGSPSTLCYAGQGFRLAPQIPDFFGDFFYIRGERPELASERSSVSCLCYPTADRPDGSGFYFLLIK